MGKAQKDRPFVSANLLPNNEIMGKALSKEDRYRACYLNACLKRVNRDYMTNASLRERFNIDKMNSSMVSRLLNETCALGLVYVSPDSTSDKNRKYLPFWA